MDKKAKNILFKTYWSGGGWRAEPKTEPQEFAYAKSQGLMFDPVSITHDACLTNVLNLAKHISSNKATRAFLSSLSTRRLDWRSSVASYHLASLMASHHYTLVHSGQSYSPDGSVLATSFTCAVCRDVVPGLTIGDDQYTDEDLNVLNFERIKWGGVRHGQLIYTWFDLQELLRADIPEPTEEDVVILQAILATVESSQPGDHPGTLEKRLAGVVKSSKNVDFHAEMTQ